MQILGGHVQALIEAYEFQQRFQGDRSATESSNEDLKAPKFTHFVAGKTRFPNKYLNQGKQCKWYVSHTNCCAKDELIRITVRQALSRASQSNPDVALAFWALPLWIAHCWSTILAKGIMMSIEISGISTWSKAMQSKCNSECNSELFLRKTNRCKRPSNSRALPES